jgi:ATP synthase protein I
VENRKKFYTSAVSEEEPDNKGNTYRKIAAFITIPFVIAVPPVLGTWIGMWLDTKLGTTPYLTLVWAGLGMAAGFREMLRILKKFG